MVKTIVVSGVDGYNVRMGKLFAGMVIIVAVLAAVPIFRHTWPAPQPISSTGHTVDREMKETMIEAGVLFLAAQLLLGFFVWRFADRKVSMPIRRFPGGAGALIVFAIVVVGIEVLALGMVGERAWAAMYFTPSSSNALLVQAQAEQFAYNFRYPGPDGRLGPTHLDKVDDANQNSFGLDKQLDPDSRDDIVSNVLAVPVNREVHLLMHARDVGHSFYVRELRMQQDFVPGLDLSIHFTANTPGRYEIVCTKLCGLGHYNMKSYLLVLSRSDFDHWLKQKAAEQ
jgi:cytochrome c oxidase subunit 2